MRRREDFLEQSCSVRGKEGDLKTPELRNEFNIAPMGSDTSDQLIGSFEKNLLFGDNVSIIDSAVVWRENDFVCLPASSADYEEFHAIPPFVRGMEQENSPRNPNALHQALISIGSISEATINVTVNYFMPKTGKYE